MTLIDQEMAPTSEERLNDMICSDGKDSDRTESEKVTRLTWPYRAVRHVWRNRKYLSVIKLLNMGLLNVEYLLGRTRLIGRPYVFKIETTNICNGGCRLCPTGMGYRGRELGVMSLETFRGIIDKIKFHATTVDLSNWGDPLITPDIYSMIRYAHDSGLWTYISSNLHAFRLGRDDAERMIRSGLDFLNCSIHAVSQETYERYQPGKNLNGTIEKIRSIIETKKRLGGRTPVIQIFFVVTKHNEHEIDGFSKLAEELGCQAVFIPASLNLRFADLTRDMESAGLSREESENLKREIKKNWLPKNSRWIAPWYQENHNTDNNKAKKYSCDWPWRKMVINWDGSVSVCCGEYDPKNDMGNVLDEDIRTIWNNSRYVAARKSFTKGRSENHEANPSDRPGRPCDRCIGVLE